MKTSSFTLPLVLAAGIAGLWIALVPKTNSAPPAVLSGRGGETRLHELLKARYETARRLLETEESRLTEGRSTLPTVCEAARRVRDSAIELPIPPEERRAALTSYLELTRRLEESVTRVVEKGMAPSSDQDLASYVRLDAEIALLRVDVTAK